MESAIPRPLASWLPVNLRVDLRAMWIWALTGGLVLYLGIDGGGYDPIVSGHAGVVVWWVILLAAATGILPAARVGRAGLAAIALLASFFVWSAIASTWSLSSERALEELSRLACYLGVLVLALTTYADRRAALRHVVGAVAAAIVGIAVLALLSRLRPEMFPAAQTTAAFLPGTNRRLVWPLNYWNALGALVVLGVPLLLAIATSARTLAAQAAAAAAIPIIALCGYLTFSRGSAIAAAIAVLGFIALAHERIPKLATLLVSAAGSAALIGGAAHRHALENGLTTSAARHQGATLIVAIILVCAGVALAQVGIALASRHGTPPRWLQVSPSRARAALIGAIVIAVIAALALGAPGRLQHAWHDFKQPPAAVLHSNSLSRFGSLSGNNRYIYWKTAIDALPGHVLGGYGPGSYQLVWFSRRPILSFIRNAHSLYVETLSEVGVVGLVLLAGFLLFVLVTAIRRVVASSFESRAYSAALAAACLAFIFSAGIDWIWQVPVVPVTALLLAASVLSPLGPRPARPVSPGRRASRIWVARVAMCAAAVASLVVIGIPLASTTALRQSQAAALAGNTTVALADAQTAARVEPDGASPALQQALVLELQHRFAAAATAAREATTDEPDNWQTWLVLSRVQAEAGQPGPAVVAYRRARALNPRSPIFHVSTAHR